MLPSKGARDMWPALQEFYDYSIKKSTAVDVFRCAPVCRVPRLRRLLAIALQVLQRNTKLARGTPPWSGLTATVCRAASVWSCGRYRPHKFRQFSSRLDGMTVANISCSGVSLAAFVTPLGLSLPTPCERCLYLQGLTVTH